MRGSYGLLLLQHCISFWGETALLWFAVSDFTAKCKLQYTETAFCATVQNIQKIKL
jgi:hypothetical protein